MKVIPQFANKEEGAKKVRQLVELIGLTRVGVAKELGVTLSTLDSWMRENPNAISRDRWMQLTLLAKKREQERAEAAGKAVLTTFRDVELVTELKKRGWFVASDAWDAARQLTDRGWNCIEK